MIYSNDKRDENELVNIIIGLSFPRANFPHPLYDLGYKLKGIERSFINSDGNTVKPDLIITNDNRGYLIIFEAKSGKNAEKTQLNNYRNITPDDLVENAGFNKEIFENGHDISYICYKYTFVKSKKIPAYKNLIKSIESKYEYPVLMFDKAKEYLTLELNQFKDEKLNRIVESAVEIPIERIPSFINFDQHSDKKEIRIEAIRNILSYILNGKLKFSIEELLNDIMSPYSGIEEIIGSETKKAVRNKLVKVMGQLGNRKSNYFEWDKSEKVWKINDTLSDPNFNQLQALYNLINKNDEDSNNEQMSFFELL